MIHFCVKKKHVVVYFFDFNIYAFSNLLLKGLLGATAVYPTLSTGENCHLMRMRVNLTTPFIISARFHAMDIFYLCSLLRLWNFTAN